MISFIVDRLIGKGFYNFYLVYQNQSLGPIIIQTDQRNSISYIFIAIHRSIIFCLNEHLRQFVIFLFNYQEQASMRNLNCSGATNKFYQSTVETSKITNSIVYDRKQPSTYSKPFETDYSKSYVFETEKTKKGEPTLRKTINYDVAMTPPHSKLALEKFLRKTSYFSTGNSSDQQAQSQGERPLRTQIAVDKLNSYEKIMEKLSRKEKLINQLKELSKVSVTETAKKVPGRSPAQATYISDLAKPYSSETNKDRVQRQQVFRSSKTNINNNPGIIISFRKTQPEIYSNDFEEKIKQNQNEKKSREKEQKNLQQDSQKAFKKAKNSYYTPREPKSATLRVEQMPITPSQMYSSAYIPLKTEPRQFKSIQDIRQASGSRAIKGNTSYFLKGRPSLYDFELLRILGQGKFGRVQQVIHRDTGAVFALKKISKKSIKQSRMQDQLLKEIKIQSSCQHENILQLYGYFDDTENIYLLLEYMQEGTLFSQLKRKKILNQKETADKVRDVAKAMVYLHQKGIAHRDIKPQNIVLSNNVAKLCDFGWATWCGQDRRKTYCGTFDYAAPEILEGSQYDQAVDLWCLGVLTYELLVGRAPFYHFSRKETMRKILEVQNEDIIYPPMLSQNAIAFTKNLLRKDPNHRLTGQAILKHPFLLEAPIK